MYQCTNCNKEFEYKPYGSLKIPYCKRCFKLIWKSDYGNFYRWFVKGFKAIPKDYYKEKEKATLGSGSTLPINEEISQL